MIPYDDICCRSLERRIESAERAHQHTYQMPISELRQMVDTIRELSHRPEQTENED